MKAPTTAVAPPAPTATSPLIAMISTQKTPFAAVVGDKPKRRQRYLYIRPQSSMVRQCTVKAATDHHPPPSEYADVKEDTVIEFRDDVMRLIMTILLRNKTRLLGQAWDRWCAKVQVLHDYQVDLIKVLSRPAQADEHRTELELEVMAKWAKQYRDRDPTSIAHLLGYCKRRQLLHMAFQNMRLESFLPGDPIVFQRAAPRAEDGHFTILTGECESVRFAEGSVPLLSLTSSVALRDWEQCTRIVGKGDVMAKFPRHSGFGELASLTNTKRTSTIRAAANLAEPTCQLLILPKSSLRELTEARGNDDPNSILSSALDFFRLSGLANNTSTMELHKAAKHLKSKRFMKGEILYCKGELVHSIYLVVSGEFLLDLEDLHGKRKQHAFLNSNHENCYHLSIGSILGDEGLSGQIHTYDATAISMSDGAIVFEATEGPSFDFLKSRLDMIIYGAMAYKDQSHWAAPLEVAEQNNLYSTFSSLRRCIAYSNPHRGVRTKSYFSQDVVARVNALAHGEKYDGLLLPHASKSPSKAKKAEAVRYAYDDKGHRIVVNNPHKTSVARALVAHTAVVAVPAPGTTSEEPPDTAHSEGRKTSQFMTIPGTTTAGYIPSEAGATSGHRYLTLTAMHTATEILKVAKGKAITQAKTLARENILMNEVLSKNKTQTQADPFAAEERRKMEDKFNTRIVQHHERMSGGDDDEDVILNLEKKAELHGMLASIIAGEDDDDDDSDGMKARDSDDTDDDLSHDAPAGGGGGDPDSEDETSHPPPVPTDRLDMYYAYLGKVRRRESRKRKAQYAALFHMSQHGSRRGQSAFGALARSASVSGMFASPRQLSALAGAAGSPSSPAGLGHGGAHGDPGEATARHAGRQASPFQKAHSMSAMLSQSRRADLDPLETSTPDESAASPLGPKTHSQLAPTASAKSPWMPSSPTSTKNTTLGRGLGEKQKSVSMTTMLRMDSAAIAEDDASAPEVADDQSTLSKSTLSSTSTIRSGASSIKSVIVAALLPVVPPAADASTRSLASRKASSMASPSTKSATPQTDTANASPLPSHKLHGHRGSVATDTPPPASTPLVEPRATTPKPEPAFRKAIFGSKLILAPHVMSGFHRPSAPHTRRLAPTEESHVDTLMHKERDRPPTAKTEVDAPVGPMGATVIHDAEEPPGGFLEALMAKDFPVRRHHASPHYTGYRRYMKFHPDAADDVSNRGSPWFKRFVLGINEARQPKDFQSSMTLTDSSGGLLPRRSYRRKAPAAQSSLKSVPEPEVFDEGFDPGADGGLGYGFGGDADAESEADHASLESHASSRSHGRSLDSGSVGSRSLDSRSVGSRARTRTHTGKKKRRTKEERGGSCVSDASVLMTPSDGAHHAAASGADGVDGASGAGGAGGGDGATDGLVVVTVVAGDDKDAFETFFSPTGVPVDAVPPLDIVAGVSNPNAATGLDAAGAGASAAVTINAPPDNARLNSATDRPGTGLSGDFESLRNRPCTALIQFEAFMQREITHLRFLEGRQQRADGSLYKVPQAPMPLDMTRDAETLRAENSKLVAMYNSVHATGPEAADVGATAGTQTAAGLALSPPRGHTHTHGRGHHQHTLSATKRSPTGAHGGGEFAVGGGGAALQQRPKVHVAVSTAFSESLRFSKEVDRRLNDILMADKKPPPPTAAATLPGSPAAVSSKALKSPSIGAAPTAAMSAVEAAFAGRGTGHRASQGPPLPTGLASLKEWQDFTLQSSKDIKTGPRVTLPVLGSHLGNFGQGEPVRAKAIKCHGLMHILPSDTAFEKISGPPPYLDVLLQREQALTDKIMQRR